MLSGLLNAIIQITLDWNYLCFQHLIGAGFIPNLVVQAEDNCTIPCTATCVEDCRAKGFKKGGYCKGIIQITACCCIPQ